MSREWQCEEPQLYSNSVCSSLAVKKHRYRENDCGTILACSVHASKLEAPRDCEINAPHDRVRFAVSTRLTLRTLAQRTKLG